MQIVLSKTADLSAKIRWWLLMVLVVAAPFHAFLITWLKSAEIFGGGAPLSGAGILFLISGWREIFVVTIVFLIIAELVISYILHSTFYIHFDSLDFLILLYTALSLIWFFIQQNTTQWFWGFRYDILPFLFLFFVRRANWGKVSWLIRATLISAAVVLVFGLLQATILPQNFLENFGYGKYQGEYVAGAPIAACQYLEHTQTVCRATSFFGGPTRYGTYLLLIIGLLLPFIFSQGKFKKFALALLALAIINIFLTYSRSIWIGTSAAAFATAFILMARTKCSARSIGMGIIAIFTAIFIAGTALVFSNIDLKTVLIRASSTSAHSQLLKEGIQKIIKNPLGYGLGTAGPASVHFEKFLPENWYLQIGLEMGIAGLVLFLGILFLLFKNLLTSARADIDAKKLGLFFALLAVAIAGLFTHSFEETTTVLILFGFIGIFSNLQVKIAIDKIWRAMMIPYF